VSDTIIFEQCDSLDKMKKLQIKEQTYRVSNPPYGKRLMKETSEKSVLYKLYTTMATFFEKN